MKVLQENKIVDLSGVIRSVISINTSPFHHRQQLDLLIGDSRFRHELQRQIWQSLILASLRLLKKPSKALPKEVYPLGRVSFLVMAKYWDEGIT